MSLQEHIESVRLKIAVFEELHGQLEQADEESYYRFSEEVWPALRKLWYL